MSSPWYSFWKMTAMKQRFVSFIEDLPNAMEEGWLSYLLLSHSSTILKINSFLSDWPLFST